MKRRTAREKTLQALYQIDLIGASQEEAIASVTGDKEDGADYLHELVRGTLDNQREIDRTIIAYLRGWTLLRLSYVDRAILRLAVFEMLYRDDIPEKVAINEAVELAKIFSTDESAAFINGTLSSIMHKEDNQEEEQRN